MPRVMPAPPTPRPVPVEDRRLSIGIPHALGALLLALGVVWTIAKGRDHVPGIVVALALVGAVITVVVGVVNLVRLARWRWRLRKE